MRVIINSKEIILPSSLAEFTLGQRIAFQEEHGKILDVMLKSILEIPEGLERELELSEFHFEKMFRTFSFFSGFPVDVLKESDFVDDLARIYYSSLASLFESEDQVELKPEYVFNGELWEIHPPELKNGSKLKFGEFIDSKQIIKEMIDLGESNWSAMLKLCAIYLRKKGEPYKEEFIYEGSERMELFKSLPMDIALAVGFFLTSSTNLYLNTSRSSSLPGSRVPESLVKNIMTVGAGSTS